MKNAALLGLLLLSLPAWTVVAQETSLRFDKQDTVFFYPQLNLQWGYDSENAGDEWHFADRGARTQISLEWWIKDRTRFQHGYTRLIRPESWDLKLSLELVPDRADPDHYKLQPRLNDVWLKLDSKWDRTDFWIGHKSIPYGHNPKLDPSHTFLPNQASSDLTFDRDTGLFLKMPLHELWDLELSLTAGKGDTFDYHGGWLLTGRVGTPTFKPNEFGVFAVIGEIQTTRGGETTDTDLTGVSRLGVDWVYKYKERFKLVNQLSAGENDAVDTETAAAVNLLNGVELYIDPKWTVGLSNSVRYLDMEDGDPDVELGELRATVSYAVTRNTRFRINAFSEYTDAAGSRDSGVLFQLCFNCGLKK